ncbi:MAG: 3-deoxy-D-manno-octulosonic acid transferase, partial [Candidatus Omnitrophica bacterium]|nr:3-deoxy-D-manno-octulosonic acid transferase [Candidatus Omnitrophota bacterium]
MFIIYDFIFLVFTLIYLPIYLLRKKFHPGFLTRLGILPGNLSLDRPIWIHAVSVGEAMAIKGLLEGLRKVSNKNFVISTVTNTGNKIAQGLAGGGDFVTYLPLDFSFIVRSVINRINPSVFVIAETEIWPNLISYLSRKKIPVITVNGRISDASFKGYLSIKFLLKPILEKVTLFCVQSERDAQRLSCLGVSQDKIRITGNMKFDIKGHKIEGLADYRLKLKLGPQDKLLVAGSTHPGEEELILEAYKDLCRDFGDLKLVIAPRHPQRCKEVAKIVSRAGFRSVFISSLPAQCPSCMTSPVFLLDTVGQLVSFYALADIVFVGGSLVKKGGHNILEPASCAKPILFGPYMFN